MCEIIHKGQKRRHCLNELVSILYLSIVRSILLHFETVAFFSFEIRGQYSKYIVTIQNRILNMIYTTGNANLDIKSIRFASFIKGRGSCVSIFLLFDDLN